MRKIESIEDEMRGVVTYELKDGRYASFHAGAVRQYGVAALMRAYDLEQFIPAERLAVVHHGRRVGTMPADFDPDNIKSNSFLYDPRPGDFKREGDTWIASRMLGPGDIECVAGFAYAQPDQQ